ncbi:MAG: hypothetical protein RBT75_00460 [Anaerolineae bacterium]|jgi:nitrogen regulatory protein PII|nr:hypothetical protein [Anaerolineae bacterium]
MFMVMYVLDNPDKLDAVLEAWDTVGVGGVTIIESSGIFRQQTKRRRIPIRFGFERLIEQAERGNYTLFTLVEDEETVERCTAAVESVVGDLSEPNTGILAAWPLAIVRGLPKQHTR